LKFRKWKTPAVSHERITVLAEESGLPWVLCAVLAARGACTPEEMHKRLRTDSPLESPFMLADMDKAVNRILEAIEDGERIAVYGDYDCDGVTATALLVSYLQSAGADVIYYVPQREKEGYGLNKPAIDVLKGQNTNLIVTVDNGVSAHEEVAYAATMGIDVVITDHHTPRETLPQAVAVVNPRRSDDQSAFKELAGAGVAFKLVCALENAPPEELLEYYADFAALGSIADIVPLVGENRVIARHGIERIAGSDRPGFMALAEIAGIGEKPNCEAIAFGLAPRINAAGRMSVADDAIEMLLTEDPDYAEETSRLINGHNDERKKTEDLILLETDRLLAENPAILDERIIILCGRDWHHGVVGIVSARIAKRHGKPCILFSLDGDSARGSGRSIEGFSLIEAITACSERLTRFGGHTLAAGLTLPVADVEAFTREILAYSRERYPDMPVAAYNIDVVLPPERLNVAEISAVSALEPFGAGNEAPLYMMRGLLLEAVYPTNDGRHIRLKLRPVTGVTLTAVFFGVTMREFPYKPGSRLDIVASIGVGEYNGNTHLSVKIRDLRPSGVDQERFLRETGEYLRHRRREYAQGAASRLAPEREELAAVYRFLRKSGEYTYGEENLCHELGNYGRVLVALDVMEELGLVSRGKDSIRVTANPQKVDLEDSGILRELRQRSAE
jgi:single-stranded-DNA-specific exonuclease